ncbi:MAG: response regulator [Armatimonadetes bacterium]|nr:response regulator [Armatimonadota bacterium]
MKAYTILLVEDDEMSRDMLSRRLLRRGYRVELATSAEEAMELAIDARPDLILMDMRLPRMDGWEATRLLKAQEHTREIPIIALTAHALTSDRQRALDVGCDDYLPKPVEFERLLEKLNEFLPPEAPPEGNGPPCPPSTARAPDR